MSTSNHRSADRTGRVLASVAVAAIAALAVIASFGHRSVSAQAQADPVSSFVSPLVRDSAPTPFVTDPSLPPASSALEHAAGGPTEIATTF